MRWIVITFYLIVIALTVAWIAADGASVAQTSFFALRDGAIQYSGVLALGAMSVGVFLATRPTWLEPYLNGLDKMYRLHKWLGIVGLVASIGHWFFATGFTWMMPLGIIAAPAGGGGRPEGPPPGSESGLQQVHGLATILGEWGFYLLVVLVVIALVKRIPYRHFALSHRLLSILYLVLVFHAVVLLKAAYWLQPIGILMAALMVLGSVSAVLDLLHWPARTRRVTGRVSSLHYYPELAVLEIAIELKPGWRGHRSGQFAFVRTNQFGEAHPYTMASDWAHEGNEMTFVTKALGDYTRRMATTLKAGDTVTVEGPYGRFNFDDGNQRQIWVGGGIGITPFIARMKELQRHPHGQRVDFYHPTSNVSEEALDKLRADASAAAVQVHIVAGKQAPRLTAGRIMSEVADWKDASIWFCGPPAFGRSLRRDFIRAGGRSSRFHQETFEMR